MTAREKRWRRIKRLWEAGHTQREIGRRLGVPDARVGAEIAKMRDAGWQLNQRVADPEVIADRRRRLREMWEAGETAALIAERLGVARSSVTGMVRRMQQTGELEYRRERQVRPSPQRDRIKEMWDAGAETGEIAAQLSLSACDVSGRIADLRREGLRARRRTGLDSTRERRETIAGLYRAGEPLASIAERVSGSVESIGATVSQMRSEGADLPRRVTYDAP